MSAEDDEWTKERASYGWLGKPPPELFTADKDTVKAWKDLCVEARRVARSSNDWRKVSAAKSIEKRRADLIERMKGQAA